MLSSHISRILDEVKDFYDLMDAHKAAMKTEEEEAKKAKAAEEEKKEEGKEEEKKDEEEKKNEEDPDTPATNMKKLVADITKG